jgi:hypothetical protein
MGFSSRLGVLGQSHRGDSAGKKGTVAMTEKLEQPQGSETKPVSQPERKHDLAKWDDMACKNCGLGIGYWSSQPDCLTLEQQLQTGQPQTREAVGEPRLDGQDDILAALGDAMAERGLSMYWNVNKMDESAKALLDRVADAALRAAGQQEQATQNSIHVSNPNAAERRQVSFVNTVSGQQEQPREQVEEALAKWNEYIDKMRVGIHGLVTEQSREMASLQLEMAERFVQDLAALAAAPPPKGAK